MMMKVALISSKFQELEALKSVTKACLSSQSSEEATGQIVISWQTNATQLFKMKLQEEIAPCIWLEIPHLKVVDLFNLKLSLEKDQLTVQQELVRCIHQKAHKHLNSLITQMNL